MVHQMYGNGELPTSQKTGKNDGIKSLLNWFDAVLPGEML
jgi:hypothetical protein